MACHLAVFVSLAKVIPPFSGNRCFIQSVLMSTASCICCWQMQSCHPFSGHRSSPDKRGRREGDSKKKSRQFATNVRTIYDILRQFFNPRVAMIAKGILISIWKRQQQDILRELPSNIFTHAWLFFDFFFALGSMPITQNTFWGNSSRYWTMGPRSSKTHTILGGGEFKVALPMPSCRSRNTHWV